MANLMKVCIHVLDGSEEFSVMDASKEDMFFPDRQVI